jgi:hypothetical protein
MRETAIAAPEDDDPIAALRSVAAERTELEREEEVLVRRARNRGLTWAAIAGALGVSKQAVHQKHGGGRRWRREP